MIVLGPLAAIIVAWATESVRDDMGVANVALVLALVCVAAALVHPGAGLFTSAVAALALNYFHTVPIHSLRMSQSDEITTVVLLVVHGLAVSVGATLRARSKVGTHRTNVSDAAGHDLRTLLAEGSSLVAAWQTAVLADTGHAASLDVIVLADTGTAADKGKVRALPAAAGTYRGLGIAEEKGVDGQLVLFRPAMIGNVTVAG